MKTESIKKPGHLKKSFMVTTLVCMVIAALTLTIWDGSYWQHLVISIGFGYSSVVCSHLLVYFFPGISVLFNSLISMFVAIVIGTTHAHFWLLGFAGYSAREGLLPIIILGVVFTGVCFIFFYTYEQRLIAEAEMERAKRKESEHEKALALSQLSVLQSQIEPHFLFNTLANINALIEQDNQKAKKMLNKLTELLRVTLSSSREKLTRIGQEVDMVEAYLAIQQIRLGERLTYKILCSDSVREIPIPPFTIQPLVENAIQHGIELKATGGEVIVSISLVEKGLEVCVKDNGVGFTGVEAAGGHGLGLVNIRNRLDTLFEQQAVFTLKENESGGVSACIVLPLQGLEDLNL